MAQETFDVGIVSTGPLMRCLLVALLSILPGFMVPLCAAEVWYFPMKNGRPGACVLRNEKTIDELWDKLEKETCASWSIPKDMSMLPGVVLQSAKINKEYSLYRSREACEYERERWELVLSGDPKKIEDYKRTQTKEMTLEALVPKTVANKQEWLDGFAGCTDARIQAGFVTKGKVDETISFCDCVATDVAQISPGVTEVELNAKIPFIVQKCLPDRLKSNP